jgi:hypothetical protein
MVEIVVMLAILVAISTVVLTGFPGFNEAGALFGGAEQIALALRHAQNIAFAVAEVELEDQSRVTPLRIGVHFDMAAPTEYFLFVDQNQDNIYTGGVDGVMRGREHLTRGIAITALRDGNGASLSEANVVFTSPEADTAITNDVTSVGSVLTVELSAPNSGNTKTVTVRTSGQISIQ